MAMSEVLITSTTMTEVSALVSPLVTEEALDAWENITYDWDVLATEFSYSELSDPTEP